MHWLIIWCAALNCRVPNPVEVDRISHVLFELKSRYFPNGIREGDKQNEFY